MCFYLACRWDYEVTSKEMLGHSGQMAMVTNTKTGVQRLAHPADWGPHEAETAERPIYPRPSREASASRQTTGSASSLGASSLSLTHLGQP